MKDKGSENIFETDWLASKPVFYNTQTNKVSHNINDVVDLRNLDFHPEGLYNYFEFGYSVFGQTPIKNVKFLRYSSSLEKGGNGSIRIEYHQDPVDQWADKCSDKDELIGKLEKTILDWERAVDGEIVIPTSGGYDSRLLNLLVSDKNRIRSFTYGVSENQLNSMEIVKAEKISEILGTRWEPILLGQYHRYFREWGAIFGSSTHAHGMYHIEFYKKVLKRVYGNNPFLSGIFGDVWAGSTDYISLNMPRDLRYLGYSHGLCADASQLMLKTDHDIRDSFWEDHREKLNDYFYQVIFLIRLKIILISYLIRVPQDMFGFKAWSPFLEQDIALSMLTLPSEWRKQRKWQRNLFRDNGLDLESMSLRFNKQNNLNYQAMRQVPLKPLDMDLLSEVVRPRYIEWINSKIKKQSPLKYKISNFRRSSKINAVLNRLRIKEERLNAYYAYLTLKPIEELLIKRNLSSKLDC
ncbi:MAG: hypothetical protein F6K00_30365 [Leptolyngbya sp. SIOISBB]|nr:hypothetical protein [Leptolyngbya sp. SIOISBB]